MAPLPEKIPVTPGVSARMYRSTINAVIDALASVGLTNGDRVSLQATSAPAYELTDLDGTPGYRRIRITVDGDKLRLQTISDDGTTVGWQTTLDAHTGHLVAPYIESAGDVAAGANFLGGRLYLSSGQRYVTYGDNGVNQELRAWDYPAATSDRFATSHRFYNLTRDAYAPVIASNVSAPSDARLKDVTGDVSDPLAMVEQLHLVRYTLKQDDADPQIGVLWHELKAIAPELVSTADLPEMADDLPGDGHGLGPREMGTVDLSPLGAIAAAAVAQLKTLHAAQIAALEERIAALEPKETAS